MKEEKNVNNTVGYRKPPVTGQFRPGASGNPSGRSKSFKNTNNTLSDVINKELSEKITLSDGSKITKAEALIKQMVNGGIKGDAKKASFVFKAMEKAETFNLGQKLLDKLISDGTVSKNDIIDYVNGDKARLIDNMTIIVNDQETKDLIESLGNTITER